MDLYLTDVGRELSFPTTADCANPSLVNNVIGCASNVVKYNPEATLGGFAQCDWPGYAPLLGNNANEPERDADGVVRAYWPVVTFSANNNTAQQNTLTVLADNNKGNIACVVRVFGQGFGPGGISKLFIVPAASRKAGIAALIANTLNASVTFARLWTAKASGVTVVCTNRLLAAADPKFAVIGSGWVPGGGDGTSCVLTTAAGFVPPFSSTVRAIWVSAGKGLLGWINLPNAIVMNKPGQSFRQQLSIPSIFA